MNKICTYCNVPKPLVDFHKKKSTIDGYDYYCKTCQNSILRERRKNNGDSITKKYEKTLKGKLVRTYRNMLSRVKGIVKSKSHLYEGLEILDKETFYCWSLADPDYNKIFNAWVDSNYQHRLSPSIDRRYPDKGYTLDNIRWLTHSENSSLSNHKK